MNESSNSSQLTLESLCEIAGQLNREPVCTSILVAPACFEWMKRLCGRILRSRDRPSPLHGIPIVLESSLSSYTAKVTFSDGTSKVLDLRPEWVKSLERWRRAFDELCPVCGELLTCLGECPNGCRPAGDEED